MLNVSNVCNMLQYRLKFETVRTIIAKYILLFYSCFLSPHHRYLSLRLLFHLCLLYSSSTARRSPKATTRHRRSHQRPPLDTTDHLSSLFCFRFFFFWLLLLFTFFGCGLIGGLGNGWVRMGKLVVGGFGLWVMAVVGWLLWVMGYSGGWVGWWWVNRWWCRSLFWFVFVFVFLFWWLWFGGGFDGSCGLILVVVVVVDDDDDEGGI